MNSTSYDVIESNTQESKWNKNSLNLTKLHQYPIPISIET